MHQHLTNLKLDCWPAQPRVHQNVVFRFCVFPADKSYSDWVWGKRLFPGLRKQAFRCELLPQLLNLGQQGPKTLNPDFVHAQAHPPAALKVRRLHASDDPGSLIKTWAGPVKHPRERGRIHRNVDV